MEFRDTAVRKARGDAFPTRLDLQPLIDRDTVLVQSLKSPEWLDRHFLEFGALCWPNGLELNGESLHRKLREFGLLRPKERVAWAA